MSPTRAKMGRVPLVGKTYIHTCRCADRRSRGCRLDVYVSLGGTAALMCTDTSGEHDQSCRAILHSLLATGRLVIVQKSGRTFSLVACRPSFVVVLRK